MYEKSKRSSRWDLPPNITKVLVALIGLIGLPFIFVITVTFFEINIFEEESIEDPKIPCCNPPNEVTFLESQKTGVGNRETYQMNLGENEFLVGDAGMVQDNGLQDCNVFWIEGPESVELTVTDGAWYRYADVNTQAERDRLIQGRVSYLEDEHWFCQDQTAKRQQITSDGVIVQ